MAKSQTTAALRTRGGLGPGDEPRDDRCGWVAASRPLAPRSDQAGGGGKLAQRNEQLPAPGFWVGAGGAAGSYASKMFDRFCGAAVVLSPRGEDARRAGEGDLAAVAGIG